MLRLNAKPQPYWELNRSIPGICLPSHLNKSELIDITCIGDGWKKYMDKSSGKIHDCALYYQMYLKELEGIYN